MQSVLNEGSFLDAITDIANSTYDDIKNARKKNQSTYMYGSISRYAKKLTMTFPVICDNTVPIKTAQLISKAHEKNLVSLFEMLFASMSLNGTNGIEILGSIHKNIDSTSIDDIIDNIEKAVGEAGYPLTRAELADVITEMVYDLKYNQKVLPVESLSEKSLNDYIVRKSPYSGTVVMEAGKNSYNDGYNKGYIDGKKYQQNSTSDQYTKEKSRREKDQESRNSAEYYGKSPESGKEKRSREQREKEREEDRLQRTTEREQDRKQREKERSEDVRQKEAERNFRLMQSRVKDVDYKKANELQPSVLTVQFSVDNGKDGVAEYKTFNAGIKSRLVGSDPMEIVERISATKSNKLTFKDLIRATTGEISLVKDFIMATKQAKINAKNAAKRGETAKMWNLLSARSKKNVVAGKGLKSNEANAITTLLISQETVNYIDNQYKINLESPKEASKIMADYNLLAIVIADEANETAKFLYDGNNSFELLSYDALSKEQKDDRNYNRAINLINKSGR